MMAMWNILKVDFNAQSNVWVIQLQLPDGRKATAQFTPDAFKAARSCAMGQFLLHSWFSRATIQPSPTEEKVA
jgi:hypothetical protein